jgi:hypothetical protein
MSSNHAVCIDIYVVVNVVSRGDRGLDVDGSVPTVKSKSEVGNYDIV